LNSTVALDCTNFAAPVVGFPLTITTAQLL
jgi:hypothetical protein